MSARFGTARGLSPEDACARYVLMRFGSRFPDDTIWHPDPLDEQACLNAVRRDDESGEWFLDYSWREMPPVARAAEAS